ncbi:hypothetical protein LPJ61_004150 [Coemansia biformis]|uniref:Uncharacterized protein n=1 Tax=Coemansia biformis TaxID=1286918 RepID=A0A9W8CXJ5_9FUNG|nr:hypothetical protein LPJ61_004150 [Coemansia biformis]
MLIHSAAPRNRVRALGFVWPDALHLRGSVIRISFPPVLIMTGYGVGIAFLIRQHPNLAVNLSIMTPVAVVLSLLLVFRTNSAYDRFWEGRKLWQDLIVSSRNLIRNIWCGTNEKSVEDRLRKQQVLKEISAFVIAIKHYLRGEDGIEYADFDGLLSPELRVRLMSTHDPVNYGTIGNCGVGHNSPEQRGTSHANLYAQNQQQSEGWERACEAPLPMLILYQIQKYVDYSMATGTVTAQLYANMLGQVNQLAGLMGGCERIISTPIPLAYHIHLHHSLYLYLLVLPWALGSMGLPHTIILQAIISFMMLGIDAISREIQNPFGYDHNDLPLDVFCEALLVDLNYVLRHRAAGALEISEDTLSNDVGAAKKPDSTPVSA